MTSTPPAQGTSAVAIERAVAAALETVRRNIAAFGDSYPDDTTTDGRYPLRPAAGGIPEGGNRGLDDELLAGDAVARVASTPETSCSGMPPRATRPTSRAGCAPARTSRRTTSASSTACRRWPRGGCSATRTRGMPGCSPRTT